MRGTFQQAASPVSLPWDDQPSEIDIWKNDQDLSTKISVKTCGSVDDAEINVFLPSLHLLYAHGIETYEILVVLLFALFSHNERHRLLPLSITVISQPEISNLIVPICY